MPNTAKNKRQLNLVVETKTCDQLEILANKDLKHCPCCGSELDHTFNAGKYKGQKPTALAAKLLEKIVQRMIDDEII
tara:strand:- start:369 stop:599 length:231 start_codon:yes stop_codon:yes gene_type:complete